MRLLLIILFTLSTLQAQSFSQQKLLGSWELSSVKSNSFISFGKYIGKQRGEVLELTFNQQGRVKVVNTGDIYNYEVINGDLKIYETKVYKNNYKIKNKYRYDLFRIVGNFEGCDKVKVVKKKIMGYTSRHKLKMCKISNLPKPIYQESILKYKF